VRLVLDTNVVISALVWGGAPFKLLRAATDGDIELLTSPVLLAELRGVLTREHLASRLATQQSSVEQAERVNDIAAPGVMNLLCGLLVVSRCRSPMVAG
jgi:uncharacterized protein